MLIKTVFAGFGGQGVISMGLNLAQAAMREGRDVTYLPSYGAEVRGGTANCTVAISDEEIASPVASSPEFIAAMNQPSMIRFQYQLQSGGVFRFGLIRSSHFISSLEHHSSNGRDPSSANAHKMHAPFHTNTTMMNTNTTPTAK